MDKKVDIIQDLEGRKVVIIHDILFKGKRTFDWDDVKKYKYKICLYDNDGHCNPEKISSTCAEQIAKLVDDIINSL